MNPFKRLFGKGSKPQSGLEITVTEKGGSAPNLAHLNIDTKPLVGPQVFSIKGLSVSLIETCPHCEGQIDANTPIDIRVNPDLDANELTFEIDLRIGINTCPLCGKGVLAESYHVNTRARTPLGKKLRLQVDDVIGIGR